PPSRPRDIGPPPAVRLPPRPPPGLPPCASAPAAHPRADPPLPHPRRRIKQRQANDIWRLDAQIIQQGGHPFLVFLLLPIDRCHRLALAQQVDLRENAIHHPECVRDVRHIDGIPTP